MTLTTNKLGNILQRVYYTYYISEASFFVSYITQKLIYMEYFFTFYSILRNIGDVRSEMNLYSQEGRE